MNKIKFSSVDEYIAACPPDKQKLLEQLRTTIHAAAPDAQEKISYQMPTFYLNGNLVHFSALKNHMGFYPTNSGMNAFEHELARYKSTPGAVNFPLDEPLPLKLVAKIVKFRAAENRKKVQEKNAKKK